MTCFYYHPLSLPHHPWPLPSARTPFFQFPSSQNAAAFISSCSCSYDIAFPSYGTYGHTCGPIIALNFSKPILCIGSSVVLLLFLSCSPFQSLSMAFPRPPSAPLHPGATRRCAQRLLAQYEQWAVASPFLPFN